MTGRCFVDTNIIVYAQSADGDKTARALEILQSTSVLSTQVINETVSVLTRKYGFTVSEAHDVAESLMDLCEAVPVDVATVRKSFQLSRRYALSHWDSLIVAAALLADCDILYSEDLQQGQIFEDRLTVVNPLV